MSPHLFSFLLSFKCQSLLLNQLSFCPLFCGILWCIMFPGHGMWWKVGSGWIQMAEIFTHSKVTVSSKSHPKQISAQMPRLAGLGHSFLMQWQRHFICLELNHHCYSITVTLIGQTLWSRDSIKHEHVSQNLIRNFRSLGDIYWMQKLMEGMGFFSLKPVRAIFILSTTKSWACPLSRLSFQQWQLLHDTFMPSFWIQRGQFWLSEQCKTVFFSYGGELLDKITQNSLTVSIQMLFYNTFLAKNLWLVSIMIFLFYFFKTLFKHHLTHMWYYWGSRSNLKWQLDIGRNRFCVWCLPKPSCPKHPFPQMWIQKLITDSDLVIQCICGLLPREITEKQANCVFNTWPCLQADFPTLSYQLYAGLWHSSLPFKAGITLTSIYLWKVLVGGFRYTNPYKKTPSKNSH